MLYEHYVQRFRMIFERIIRMGLPHNYYDPWNCRLTSYTLINHPIIPWERSHPRLTNQALVRNVSIRVAMIWPHVDDLTPGVSTSSHGY